IHVPERSTRHCSSFFLDGWAPFLREESDMTCFGSVRLQHLLSGAKVALIASSLVWLGYQKTEPSPLAASGKLADEENQTAAALPKEAGGAGAKEGAFAPLVELQDEDYAEARSRFQTKLTRKGPSPQKGAPPKPPVGVTEVEYL